MLLERHLLCGKHMLWPNIDFISNDQEISFEERERSVQNNLGSKLHPRDFKLLFGYSCILTRSRRSDQLAFLLDLHNSGIARILEIL